MPELRELHLGEVSLKDLPACPQLRTISLIDVPIVSLEILAHCPQLKQIQLKRMPIQILPGDVQPCRELERMVVEQCQHLT